MSESEKRPEAESEPEVQPEPEAQSAPAPAAVEAPAPAATPARSPWILVGVFALGVALTALIFLLTPLGKGGVGSGQAQSSAASATSAEASSAAEDTSAASSAASEAGSAATAASMAQVVKDSFPSWQPDSPTLAQLISFVDEVTNKDSVDYIEPAERIATFDMDGTIICEKAPIYVDYCMLLKRVLADPSYQAPQEMVELCRQIRANADKDVVDDSLDAAKGKAFAEAFAGMTPEEFKAYTQRFMAETKVEGFEGMTYGESFYKPMLEVIDYLRAHDFDVWIVSACERDVSRAATEALGFSPDHVVATDLSLRATGQGDTSAPDYTFTPSDTLVYGGQLYEACAKLNKVVAIQREIGRRPVLSFGNSSGDFAMLNYAQTNPNHKGMGFFVVCDDTTREYGNDEKAADYRNTVSQYGLTGISMRDDWATIYGPGVKKTELVAAASSSASASSAEASSAAAQSDAAQEELQPAA